MTFLVASGWLYTVLMGFRCDESLQWFQATFFAGSGYDCQVVRQKLLHTYYPLPSLSLALQLSLGYHTKKFY